MRRLILAGIPCFLVLIGCTHVRPTVPAAAPTEPERAASQTVPASGSETPPSGTALPAPTGPASAEPDNGSKTTAQSAGAAAGSSSQSGAGGSSRPKAKPSTVKSPGNAPAAAGSPAAAAKPTAAPAGDTSARQTTPSAPALDLGALEQRLKETRAIGLFTKLSLKNQVDDLLNQFRAFHGRQGATSLAELRQRYDGLLLKVLSLLQDGDPALATAISSSREALWGILADPVKFRQTVT
jgi:type IV secretory pathway TrbL component